MNNRLFGGTIVALATVALAGGCSVTPVGFASNVVGDTISDSSVQKKHDELRGASVAQADEMFGERLDTMQGLTSDHEWIIYPAGDMMNNQRYVVEAARGKVVALSKVQKNRDYILDGAQKVSYEKKSIGYTAHECERNLGLGRPVLSTRSKRSGKRVNLYDARLVKGLNKPHYCVLRFGTDGKCEAIEIATVRASTKPRPFG